MIEKQKSPFSEGLFGGIMDGVIPGSSMVEQEAVNFEVAGSSPAPGAKLDESPFFYAIKDRELFLKR